MRKHPQLSEKLQLLYELNLNSTVRSSSELAQKLGISKQSVSKWCRGTPTSRGDCIPLKQLDRVAALFKVKPEWFSLSKTDFELQVRYLLESNISKVSSLKISTATLPITSLEIFGREDELTKLDDYWFNSKTNVVEIIAFGGSGKSSLINKWLSEKSRSHYSGAEYVYAWSFYWHGKSEDGQSSGDYFIEHALNWFGDRNASEGTAISKVSRLVKLIRESNSLVILDGLEPLQHHAGEQYGKLKNPAVSLLIKELAVENTGLCVITSRYPVTDLNALHDDRVATIELDRISKKSGIKLLKRLGLSGSEEDFELAVESYLGHPLSLTLLAGYLSTVHRGKISYRTSMVSVLDEMHSRNHVEKLLGDYISWLDGSPRFQLLRLLSLLGKISSFNSIQELVELKSVSGLTDQLRSQSNIQLNYTIKELKEARLISCSEIDDDTYIDCHPLVKDYISQHLRVNDLQCWEEGHALIFMYLSARLIDQPSCMSEYEPFFRAIIHGSKAGMYEEAFEIYFERVKRQQFSMVVGCSHRADQACISSFFDREWDQPTSKLGEEAQIFLLMSASTNLIYLGKISDAIKPARVCIDWFRIRELWLQAGLAAAPLLSMFIASGEIDAALELIVELEEFVPKTNNEVAIAMCENFKAYILYLKGDSEKARLLFEKSDKVLTQLVPSIKVEFPTISSYYCKFLLEESELSFALERSLKTFAWRKNNSWQVTFDTTSLLASDLLVLGLIFLKLGDKANARKQLAQQVELFRTADEWLYLPTGLNSRAKFYMSIDEFDAAVSDLEESISISRSTGARFGEWEAYIELANLYACTEKLSLSAEYLDKAKSIPDMHRFKFRDIEIAELEQLHRSFESKHM